MTDIQKHQDKLAEKYNLVGNPKLDKAYQLAYEQGHSGGEQEVENYFIDLVDLIEIEPQPTLEYLREEQRKIRKLIDVPGVSGSYHLSDHIKKYIKHIKTPKADSSLLQFAKWCFEHIADGYTEIDLGDVQSYLEKLGLIELKKVNPEDNEWSADELYFFKDIEPSNNIKLKSGEAIQLVFNSNGDAVVQSIEKADAGVQVHKEAK